MMSVLRASGTEVFAHCLTNSVHFLQTSYNQCWAAETCLHNHDVVAWLANAMCVVMTHAGLVAEISGYAGTLDGQV